MQPKRHYPSDDMIVRARQLRHGGTIPERILWGLLRGGHLAGLKFRRQHPIGPFIVDFYCHESGLIVELDGMSHELRGEQDCQRTRYLEGLGLRVFRVTNDQLLDDSEAVARGIARASGIELQ
jgi:very-short-patch-repair endonuclease